MAALTLTQPVATARGILNDSGIVTYTAADLLGYGNDALDEILTMAPHYFYERGELTCVAESSAQTVSFADAHALVSVDQVQDGDVVTPCTKPELDRFDPGWMTATSAAAVHWFPHADSRMRFYVYPPAPTGQVLVVTYVRIPSEYAVGADTGLPTTLSRAIADYIVYRAMSRDEEHINSNRAQAFLTAFQNAIKGA